MDKLCLPKKFARLFLVFLSFPEEWHMMWINIFLAISFSLLPARVAFAGRTEKGIGNIIGPADYQKKWAKIYDDEKLNFRALIDLMRTTETGEKIFKAANYKVSQQGQTLLEILHAGPGSLTDTTLLRKFSASSPLQVSYEQKSIVSINQDLTVLDAMLDLSHELVHFIYRRPFNPYADKGTALDFIVTTIEGQGGEVDAFVAECKVLKELMREQNSPRFHCHHIKDENGHISRELAVKYFYRSGHDDYQELKAEASEDLLSTLPHLSADHAIFISSAYGHSYPLAAWKEFHLVRGRACENEKRRLEYINRQSRGPASIDVQKVNQNFSQRCAGENLERSLKQSAKSHTQNKTALND